MVKIKNYINGEFQNALSGQTLESINPATGEVFATLPDSDVNDLNQAVEAAQKAQPSWGKQSAEFRAGFLAKMSLLILENLDALAEAETTDNGKPLWLSQSVDIPRAAANFKFFADCISQFSSESHAMPGNAINYTLRQPLGVVGCISPWNLPLYLFTWKIAPALAAGNCVIAKPSEVTPYSSFLLSEICQQAGLPDGVLNIIHGSGKNIGQSLVEHPNVKAISFTGGTVTGQQIAALAAPMFKKLSLEMGGKNATLVFADCDFERTVSEVTRAAFANQGQICLCGSRILVEESIYTPFKNALLEKVKQLNVGDPLQQNSKQGAIVSEPHLNKIEQAVLLAKKDGGIILCGGHKIHLKERCQNGYFFEPTLIENLDENSTTNQAEIFGPVATLIPFKDEQDALAKANATDYGLAFSIWSQNISRCHRLAESLEAGIIWVNCWMLRDLRTPFGGVKNSGVGREGGFEALKFFTEPKNVCVQYGE